jgi:hypothetical protein
MWLSSATNTGKCASLKYCAGVNRGALREMTDYCDDAYM